MIVYTNIQRHNGLPFEKYLQLDGYSHSFLKHQKNGIKEHLNITDKMRLGSLVDALLTQPDEFDALDPQAEKAKRIAEQIKETFPFMIDRLKTQISFTAVMEYEGFKMKTTARLDWELEGFAPIDLKVTGAKNDKEFRDLSEYMGYPNQMWHYARIAGYRKAYILPYSVTAKRCLGIVPIQVPDRNMFWENMILKFGTV